jgi:hypothetical protein
VNIEKNIPLPVGRAGNGSGRAPVYPFRLMEVGDSFMVPAQTDKEFARVEQAAYRANRNKSGCKYTARRVDGGIRVWRIE